MQMDRPLRDRRDRGPPNPASSLWGRGYVHHLLHARAGKTSEGRASRSSRAAGKPSEGGRLCTMPHGVVPAVDECGAPSSTQMQRPSVRRRNSSATRHRRGTHFRHRDPGLPGPPPAHRGAHSLDTSQAMRQVRAQRDL